MKRTPLARSTPLRKKAAKKRTWKCAHCLMRSTGTVCGGCKIRRATKRTTLKAKCDTLARELCKRLAGGKCARCGGPGSDWAHRFPRRHHSVRWSMENCDFLCRKCHQLFTDHPATFTLWLIEKMGNVALIDLERRANERWSASYPEVLAYLRSYPA